MRRHHVVLTALTTLGLALTLFQNWYISLPLEDASRIDICRLTPVINCFRSLHAHGEELAAFGLPVFPALAGLLFFQAMLCAFAWAVAPARSEAWLALARVVSLPASGLAVFVLLNDLTVAKATSVSALLVAACSLAISVLAVLHGMHGLGRAGAATALPACAAVLLAFFLQGALASRRGLDLYRSERESELPSIAYPMFLHDLPRGGAAALGDPVAPSELVLFVDPAEENSRKLMATLADAAPEYASKLYITVYAAGEAGADLIHAHRAGALAAYLKSPSKGPGGDRAELDDLVRRQQAALKGLAAPTAIAKGRKWEGSFDLREALEAAANP